MGRELDWKEGELIPVLVIPGNNNFMTPVTRVKERERKRQMGQGEY